MKIYKSIAKGWLTLEQAQSVFKTTPVMLRRWRNDYPKCFEVINGKCIHVNQDALDKKVKRIWRG